MVSCSFYLCVEKQQFGAEGYLQVEHSSSTQNNLNHMFQGDPHHAVRLRYNLRGDGHDLLQSAHSLSHLECK